MEVQPQKQLLSASRCPAGVHVRAGSLPKEQIYSSPMVMSFWYHARMRLSTYMMMSLQ